MKDIFAGLYNKVIGFFQQEKTENTREIASNRLKLVLMHDRTKLDPLTMDRMKQDLVDVFSKYVVIDTEAVDLNLAGEGDSVFLMLNIPVVRAKTEEELAEIHKEIDAKKAAKEEKEEDDDDEEEDDDDDDDDIEESSEDDDDEDDDSDEVVAEDDDFEEPEVGDVLESDDDEDEK